MTTALQRLTDLAPDGPEYVLRDTPPFTSAELALLHAGEMITPVVTADVTSQTPGERRMKALVDLAGERYGIADRAGVYQVLLGMWWMGVSVERDDAKNRWFLSPPDDYDPEDGICETQFCDRLTCEQNHTFSQDRRHFLSPLVKEISGLLGEIDP